MSADIGLTWNNALLRADVSITNGDLTLDKGLDTAVTVSLFTDRQALPGDVIPDGGGPRGWWGNAYLPFQIGSRLWLLKRSVMTQAILNAAQDYAMEALQWMIDYGVAGSIAVVATATGLHSMNLAITITQKGSSRTYNKSWSSMVPTGALAA